MRQGVGRGVVYAPIGLDEHEFEGVRHTSVVPSLSIEDVQGHSQTGGEVSVHNLHVSVSMSVYPFPPVHMQVLRLQTGDVESGRQQYRGQVALLGQTPPLVGGTGEDARSVPVVNGGVVEGQQHAHHVGKLPPDAVWTIDGQTHQLHLLIEFGGEHFGPQVVMLGPSGGQIGPSHTGVQHHEVIVFPSACCPPALQHRLSPGADVEAAVLPPQILHIGEVHGQGHVCVAVDHHQEVHIGALYQSVH